MSRASADARACHGERLIHLARRPVDALRRLLRELRGNARRVRDSIRVNPLRRRRPMAQSTYPLTNTTSKALESPARQAYELLHWGFVAAPVLAGIDKLFDLMTNWDAYLAPAFARLSPLSPHGTMVVVGIVEMAAGLLVATKPKIGGVVVAGWLAGIILNLALLGHAWDIALRDLGLLLGALALSRLATAHEKREIP
jgi:hypothetical protein